MMTKNITMDDLYRELKGLSKKDIIVDVREPEEYSAGHVPGSRNFPLDHVHEHAAELKKYDRVIVHCQRGRRAGMACEALGKLGLTNLVCISSSGMGDWVAAGYPVEK